MYYTRTKDGRYKYHRKYKDSSGKWRHTSVTLDRRNGIEADRLLTERINAERARSDPARLTLSDLVDDYLADQEQTVKQATYKRNYFACKGLMKILDGDVKLQDLNAGYIRKCFLAYPEDNHRRNERIVRLKAMIRWGYKNGLMDNTVCIDRLDLFREDNAAAIRRQNKYLESEEVQVLMDSFTAPYHKNLLIFLILSGLRFGEAAALTWDDVDLETRVIHVNKTYDSVNDVVTTPKTLCSIRDVFMQDELFELMEFLELEPDRTDPIFPNGYYSFNKYLKIKSREVLGREITPHTLRHTSATLMLQAGVPVETISRRLGHTSVTVTKSVYLHITKQMKAYDREITKEIHLLFDKE